MTMTTHEIEAVTATLDILPIPKPEMTLDDVFEWLRVNVREYLDLGVLCENRDAGTHLLFDVAEFLEAAGRAGACGVPLRLKRDEGSNCSREDKLAMVSSLVAERDLSEPGDLARRDLGEELARSLAAAVEPNAEDPAPEADEPTVNVEDHEEGEVADETYDDGLLTPIALTVLGGGDLPAQTEIIRPPETFTAEVAAQWMEETAPRWFAILQLGIGLLDQDRIDGSNTLPEGLLSSLNQPFSWRPVLK